MNGLNVEMSMALKDLIDDALKATAPDDEIRRATLTEVLDAVGGGSDAEILACLSKIITVRQQKAGSYTLAGQTEQATREHAEIAVLREFLRQAGASAAKAEKKTAKPDKKKAAPKPAAQEETAPKPAVSRRQWLMIALALAVTVAAVGGYFWLGRGAEDAGNLENAGPQQMTYYSDDRTMGNPKAPIVLLEYAAPSCPHCALFNATAIPNLKRDYIDTGKVYYVFRVFPIMPADGAVEAIARTCFPQDKYFQFIDLMFRNQDKWDPENGVTDVRGGIIQVARIAGLSTEQVDRCMVDPAAQERLNRVAADAQKKYDLHGVPDMVINGNLWRAGGASWEEVKAKLDSLLAKN
jgi:protein-disulfide isomerase